MREILFRGKRLDNGEWVYGSYYHCCGTAYGATFIVVNDFGFIEVIPHTVGQYTGLTDKNGKKIFEGDIVQYQPEYIFVPQRSVVIYCADKYNYPAFDLEQYDYVANGLQYAHEEGGCEVIGNKHDNPELLTAPPEEKEDEQT